MTSNDIRALLRAEPFEAFRMRLVDGRVFEVPHPEFAWIPPQPNNLRLVHVADGSGAFHIINVTIVVSVEYYDPSAAANGSGGQAGRG